MNTRLALVGAFIAATFVAGPSAATAQNPWRADPKASGQYMTQPSPQPLQVPNPAFAPKYAPLDGKLDDSTGGFSGYPVGVPNLNGFGGPGYGGFNAPGYGGSPYQGGLGYPGLGYTGLGHPGFATPGLGWGGYSPYNGWGNNLGGPMSWMPFW